jgi:cyclophilin family peptidyl-prolyl cis-trans isomerase
MSLARSGYYDGTPITRVLPNQFARGGDPRGDGLSSPGYTVRDEIAQRPVLRGTVGLVAETRDGSGSEFYIALSPMPERDSRGTVIGRVVGGIDVADQLQRGDVVRHVRIWDGQTMK